MFLPKMKPHQQISNRFAQAMIACAWFLHNAWLIKMPIFLDPYKLM